MSSPEIRSSPPISRVDVDAVTRGQGVVDVVVDVVVVAVCTECDTYGGLKNHS